MNRLHGAYYSYQTQPGLPIKPTPKSGLKPASSLPYTYQKELFCICWFISLEEKKQGKWKSERNKNNKKARHDISNEGRQIKNKKAKNKSKNMKKRRTMKINEAPVPYCIIFCHVGNYKLFYFHDSRWFALFLVMESFKILSLPQWADFLYSPSSVEAQPW